MSPVAILLLTWLAADPALAPTAARPETTFPDTPPGRHAAAYFHAFNQGETAMRAFFRSRVSREGLGRRSLEDRLGVYREMREEFGNLTPVRLVAGNEDELRVEVRTGHGPRLEMTFLTEGPARTFAAIRVEDLPDQAPVRAGGGEPETPEPAGPLMTAAEVAGVLRTRLDSLARAGAFSGAVLLAKGDQVLLRDAWGFASRLDSVPNRPDTRFNLGSINKAFTRLAIEQLAAAGTLRLDDTVDRWLADYPKDKGRKITIRQLLDHRGGTGDIFNQRYRAADRALLRTMDDWMDLIRDQPLEFEPGSRQQYSNAGYVILGAIIEKASGESYYDYVREHIYRPAGMTSSDHYARDDSVPRRATGYTRRSGAGGAAELLETTPTMPGRGSPAGGGYSTVDDLRRFADALRTGKLGAGDAGGIGIAGGSPGCNAVLETLGDYTLVVLANLDPPVAERVASATRGWLRRAGAGRPK